MIGILIVAHGSLGESLIQCATHVMGSRPPNLEQFGIEKNDDPCAVGQAGGPVRLGEIAVWPRRTTPGRTPTRRCR